ncbi:hypothetical protein KGY77_08330 [Candidatus Bipolaricaulota bacterium]|nr:hypothetical protein [Candidatus Bipolaricaulota bacterium]
MKSSSFRVILSGLVLVVFCAVLLSGSLVLADSNSTDESCRVSVSSGRYVAPAAELASTSDNPDFITLENSVMEVTSLPNRGRLIFDYYYKPAEVSLVYNETSPMPLELGDGLFQEFGGYYTSYPWNQRANQPYDLEYEIDDDASSTDCSVIIFKKGDDFPLDYEAELKVRPDDPKVYLKIELSNTTGREQNIDWSDKLVVAAGEELGAGTELILPRGTEEVTGEEGEVLNWPQPWKKWENFEDQNKFSVALKDVEGIKFKTYYPQKDIEFVKEWDSGISYNELQVLSWGPSYEDTLGAYPGFLISNRKPGFILKPGETKTFRVRFYGKQNS